MTPYDFRAIETRWQAHWEAEQTFRAAQSRRAWLRWPVGPSSTASTCSRTRSGAGLHVGHPEGYTATDILARYKRMRGFNVLHPMGWDAFGLPAEQYAIQTACTRPITTRKAIDNFRRQLKRFGFSYDWSRELAPSTRTTTGGRSGSSCRSTTSGSTPSEQKARPIDELVRRLEAAS